MKGSDYNAMIERQDFYSNMVWSVSLHEMPCYGLVPFAIKCLKNEVTVV